MSKFIQQLGNTLKVQWEDDTYIAYPTSGGLWNITSPAPDPPDPPDPGTYLIDTIGPGHSITNPGGTVAGGWQWHIDNNGGRGGDDWNYSYGTDFTAPADGSVTHFDVAGVGMVVKLVLDHPVTRTGATYTNDTGTKMRAVWFQHCSGSAPNGHYSQGDVIGQSGDGYGAYGAHLHVHGMVNTGNVAGADVRSCFWNFL